MTNSIEQTLTIPYDLEVGGLYKYYKRNEAIHKNNEYCYKVIALARSTQDTSHVVVYQALYDSAKFGKDSLWVRSYEEFIGELEVDGKMVPRFEKIEDVATAACNAMYEKF